MLEKSTLCQENDQFRDIFPLLLCLIKICGDIVAYRCLDLLSVHDQLRRVLLHALLHLLDLDLHSLHVLVLIPRLLLEQPVLLVKLLLDSLEPEAFQLLELDLAKTELLSDSDLLLLKTLNQEHDLWCDLSRPDQHAHCLLDDLLSFEFLVLRQERFVKTAFAFLSLGLPRLDLLDAFSVRLRLV